MARITTNTTGTQPVIKIDIVDPVGTTAITLPFVQDLTITNSTGVYSYTTFSDIDQRKLSTPADNSISTNIVIDDDAFFGTGAGSTAAAQGVQALSANKVQVYFRIYYAGTGTGKKYRGGSGFITNLAPTTSPEAPVWVTPLEIAVDGAFVDGEDA